MHGLDDRPDDGERPETQLMQRDIPRQISGMPTRLAVAFNFINLCNNNMGYRYWPNEDGSGGEVRTLELHPAQEGAMRLACEALGNYFKYGESFDGRGTQAN